MDDSLPLLSATEVRVLGSLVEKAITTPDYYPLSLNALTNACNQLSNRDPVMALDESVVLRTLEDLRPKRLASLYHGSESRVARYKHSLTETILLTPSEVALLCVLMLRGPQTVGELRTRTERLFKFDNLTEVEDALGALSTRTPQPLVVKLPRAPGTKEARYAHLLSGPVSVGAAASGSAAGSMNDGPIGAPGNSAPIQLGTVSNSAPGATADAARLTALETEVAALRGEVADLRAQLAAFRKQFE